jgi:hypothetical protein
MDSLVSFKKNETGELALENEYCRSVSSKTSHAGIIRIGFEGISQPHAQPSLLNLDENAGEHPCFN